ncbi:hypothetical protein BDZ45DRAFT_728999 [Acephala macrosclerotiorum]|nr:hypothetical protein BDZ45DRAFT_728999 [Acephala macrosclerotiorum]
MPTYHPLDLSVRLYAWDPSGYPPNIDEKAYVADPSLGEAIEEVSEEYFDRCRGVDFLGSSGSPFYLVNAGRELFFPKDKLLNGCQSIRPPAAEEGSHSATKQPATPVPPFMYATKSLKYLSQTDGAGDDDSESPLSSVPTNFDSSPTPMNGGQGTDETRGSKVNTPDKKGWSARPEKPITTKNAFLKPLDTTIPIKVQVEFSKPSFSKSFNTKLDQDICVNIFYNGEFVSSRSYRADTQRTSIAADKSPNFSGRRVAVRKEVPFVLSPLFKSVRRLTRTNIEKQWNKINRLLLAEADKWGRTGEYDMFRSPIGEYLEDLSNLSMPEDMTKMRDGGRNIGVIDVVVALGRTVVLGSISPLYEPQRKLPEGYCGPSKNYSFVPEETRPGRGIRFSRSFEHENTENDDGTSRPPSRRSTAGLPSERLMAASKGRANRRSSKQLAYADEEYHIETIMKSAPDSPSKQSSMSSQPMTMGMPPNKMPLRSSSVEESSSQADPKGRSESLTLTSSRQPTQQGPPDILLKKRSRGASPSRNSSAKRHKSSNLSGEVPEDSYMRVPSFDSTLWATPTGNPGQGMVSTPGASLGQQTVENNQRPVRQRTKTTHFDEKSPTPSGSFKQRNSKDVQPPTPTLDAGNSLLSGIRGGTSCPPTPNLPGNHGASTYKSMMFGMDGTTDEPFDLDFRFDGTGSGSGSKRASQPSNANGRPLAGSSFKRGHPETLESATSTPTTLATGSEGQTMQRRTSPRNTSARSSQPSTYVADRNQKPGGARRRDTEANHPQSMSSSMQNRQRATARNQISADELKGLLDSHQPADAIDNTFGSSFTESSANRPVRRANRKEQEAMVSDTSEAEGSPTGRLQASIQYGRQRTLFVVKGLSEDDWNLVQNQPTIDPNYKSNWKRVKILMNCNGNFKWSYVPKVTSHPKGKPDFVLRLPKTASAESERKKFEERQLQASWHASIQTSLGVSAPGHVAPVIPMPHFKIREEAKEWAQRWSESNAQLVKGTEEAEDDSSPSTTDTSNNPGVNFRKSRTTVQKPSLTEESMNAEEGPSLSTRQINISKTSILPLSSSPSTNAMFDTPSLLRPATSLGMNPIAHGHTRSRPNLAPLTTRGYTHTDKGAKTPTPKSGTFPDIKKPEMPATRARTSRNVEMLPPASSPHLPTPTPRENIAPSRSRRGHHSPVTSSPTMGPPPTSMARSRTGAGPFIFKGNSTIKDESITPSILQTRQPRTVRRMMKPNNPTGKNQYSLREPEANAAPAPPILPPAKPRSSRPSRGISTPPRYFPEPKAMTNPTGKNQYSKTDAKVAPTPPILPPPKPHSTRTSKDISSKQPVSTPTKARRNGATGKNRATGKLADAEATPPRIRNLGAKVASALPIWKPVDTCANSVLTYATKEQIGAWLRLDHDEVKGYTTRHTRMEKEGVFRAHSILMGVRYVFGADFQEIPKRKEGNKENEDERMDEGEYSAEASKRLLEEEVEEMMMSD